jgi:hypothetical protein
MEGKFMKALTKLAAIFLAATALTACDVDQTQEAELPDVDVEGGQMPKYDVDQTQEGKLPDVDVKGGQAPKFDVDVPDMDVDTDTKTKEITVPDPDVDVDVDATDENKAE